MSVYSGGNICVHLCEGGNTVPWALQKWAREGAPKIVVVIHTEKQNQENLAFLSSFMSSSGEKEINTSENPLRSAKLWTCFVFWQY